MKKRIVALLPMKANSVRVKGKNFKIFAGKPLYRWILDTLLSISEFDEIIINTDARKVLAENGLTETDRVNIRDRKPEICGDEVSMNLVLADDVKTIQADIYFMTHTTNPLLSVGTISDAIQKFLEFSIEGYDSLFSVNKVQTRFYNQNVVPLNHNPRNLIPTQDLEPWYEENSNFYIFTHESFMLTNARIGKNPRMLETPKLESVDIDTPSDWDFAEATMHYFKSREAVK